MAHPDPSYRIGAIYRTWRNRTLSDFHMLNEMTKLNAENLAKIWLMKDKPHPRVIEFIVLFFGRGKNSKGAMFENYAIVKAIRTPSPESVTEVLIEGGYDVHSIKSIQVHRNYAIKQRTAERVPANYRLH
jgi:hypothetical protein